MFSRRKHIKALDKFLLERLGEGSFRVTEFSSKDKSSVTERFTKKFKNFLTSDDDFIGDCNYDLSYDECDTNEEVQTPPSMPSIDSVPPPMPNYSATPYMSRCKVADPEPVKNEINSFLSNRFEDGAVAKQLNLYMHERDITTAMIYERCYIDRKLISKITNRTNYHPSKNTMLALCIGLRLNKDEAEDFLALAGYSFSSTSKFDLIIEYMLINYIFDLRFINEMLEKYEQPLLGA